MITVRCATADDLPAILGIANWAAAHTAANFAVEPESLETWRQSFTEHSARYPWVVAIDEDDTLVGFAKASPWKGRCAYHYSTEVTVYVAPARHGRGIGRQLYAELLPRLETQGFRTLLAGITQPNEASVRLHESFGFRHCATFERVGWKFDRWHDVAYWALHFGSPDAAPSPLLPVAP